MYAEKCQNGDITAEAVSRPRPDQSVVPGVWTSLGVINLCWVPGPLAIDIVTLFVTQMIHGSDLERTGQGKVLTIAQGVLRYVLRLT